MKELVKSSSTKFGISSCIEVTLAFVELVRSLQTKCRGYSCRKLWCSELYRSTVVEA